MIDFLELTEEQVTAWEEIQAGIRAEVEVVMGDLKAAREDVRAELESDTPDATALGTAMLTARDLQEQINEIRKGADDEFAGLLTNDQFEKYQLIREFQESCRGPGNGEGFGRGGGRRGFGSR
jgi:hypothetical protein